MSIRTVLFIALFATKSCAGYFAPENKVSGEGQAETGEKPELAGGYRQGEPDRDSKRSPSPNYSHLGKYLLVKLNSNLDEGSNKKENGSEKGEIPPFMPDGSKNERKTRDEIERIKKEGKMKKTYRHGGYYGWCWNHWYHRWYQCHNSNCYYDAWGYYRCH